jgi:hypothetical protein
LSFLLVFEIRDFAFSREAQPSAISGDVDDLEPENRIHEERTSGSCYAEGEAIIVLWLSSEYDPGSSHRSLTGIQSAAQGR